MSPEALLSLSRGHREVIPNLFRTPLIDRGAHIKEAEYFHVILGEKKSGVRKQVRWEEKCPSVFNTKEKTGRRQELNF